MVGSNPIHIFLALLIIVGFGFAGPGLAQPATQYPFCIQGPDNPGWSGCSFSSYHECQAAASGTEAECIANPWYQASGNVGSGPGADPSVPNGPIPVGPPPNSGN
jgi:hypothetical protein